MGFHWLLVSPVPLLFFVKRSSSMTFKTDQEHILPYLTDASNAPGGEAEVVFFPHNEDEILQAIAYCRSQGLRMTVSGAGTGLAGGRVPLGGAVIATERMNRVVAINPETYSAIVEPGVILGEFQREVEQKHRLYPPDPTERSCFVGGTVSTNSSGARTFKYGPTRNFVDRLRMITAQGERLDVRRGDTYAQGNRLSLVAESGRVYDVTLPSYTMPDLKHAAGYFVRPGMDAIDLFIGSEGTLGIVTEIHTRLIHLPSGLFSGIVFFPDESSTLAFVDEARSRSKSRDTSGAETHIDARALEFMDRHSLDLIRPRYPDIPVAAMGGAVWFEQETTEETESDVMMAWHDLVIRSGGLVDSSWFAVTEERQQRMRQFRHAIPETVYEYLTEHGQIKLGTDMAVPDSRLHELIAYYRSELKQLGIRAVTYGHIGNSHLHVNMLCRGDEEYQRARCVYDGMVDTALSLGGTISAEHGVGKIKKSYLMRMYGAHAISEMRRLKRIFDPEGLLGVGTMFDLDEKSHAANFFG